MAGETKVVQMRYPVDLLDKIDAAAAKRGVSRTAFVLDVLIGAPWPSTPVEAPATEPDRPAAPPDSIAGARARTREVSAEPVQAPAVVRDAIDAARGPNRDVITNFKGSRSASRK